LTPLACLARLLLNCDSLFASFKTSNKMAELDPRFIRSFSPLSLVSRC